MLNWTHNLFKRFTQSSEGFTLMELLVVIAIIAVLISVAAASYSTVQSRGRDSRRLSDMRAVQAAFEQYFAENNSIYPKSSGATGACLTNGMSTYLPGGAFPTDPKPSQSYTSKCNSSGTQYTFCAQLESTKYGNSDNSAPPLPMGSCSTCSFYCVSSVQ